VMLEERTVFKFVSPRGPSDGTSVDPDDGGVDLTVPELLDDLTVDPSGPAPEVVDRLADQPTMSATELDSTVLAKVWRALPSVSGLTTAELHELSVNGYRLRDLAATPEFEDDYRRVADSWLTLRLRGVAGPLYKHERLIRLGQLFLRLRSAPESFLEPGLAARLLKAPVVYPRAWREARRPRHELGAVDTEDGPGPSPMAQELEERREEYAELVLRTALRERLQAKVGQVHTSWRREQVVSAPADEVAERYRGGVISWLARAILGRPVLALRTAPVPAVRLDDDFYARLDANLGPNERAELSGVFDSLPNGRPEGFADLVSSVDTGELVADANRVCSVIQTLEQALATSFPSAGVHQTSESRPAVRAVGWGDLVVARESLVGYDASEIAHIENVLSGEEKLREHERTHTTELVTETETQEETETERDLQTTDRYELQSESEHVIEQDFSLEAGVNTSGRYGLTRVETSLEVGFQQSKTDARNSSLTLAKDIVSRAVERTFESVRELRRLTITEQIRELNRHGITNVAVPGQEQAPESLSGIYLWLEKIHEVELRHYGTRLMVEFHVPEPAVGLLQRTDRDSESLPKVPPFQIGPNDVRESNYLCFARRYGAEDIDPPPPAYVEIGWAWASTPNEEEDEDTSEDVVADTITALDGYLPVWGNAKVSAHPAHAGDNDTYVALGGMTVVTAVGTSFAEDDFEFDPRQPWPSGIPVSIRAHGHFDKTLAVHVAITCERMPEALTAWQLRTWEKLRAAHQVLVRERESAEEAARLAQTSALFTVQGRPDAVKREIERDELKKWAIKIMRLVPFDFDAVELVGDHEEVDPADADAQAPIVRFFEEAFEWRQMTYFLHPYFWGRRDAWHARAGLSDPDPRHLAFLRAGSARAIVPVTPGYEGRVLQYLESDPDEDELERITTPEPEEAPEDSEFEDLWLELLLNRKDDVALGSGTLSVQNGDARVSINEDSTWEASERDLGRELYIGGDQYTVAAVAGEREIDLDEPYRGETDPEAPYATGTVPFGPPWLVRIPTSLVILSEERDKLPTFD
jgi:hypothetical protein